MPLSWDDTDPDEPIEVVEMELDPFEKLQFHFERGLFNETTYKVCVQIKRLQLGLEKMNFNLQDDLVILTGLSDVNVINSLQWLEKTGLLRFRDNRILISF